MLPQPFQPKRVQEDMTAVVTLERDAELMLRVRAGEDACFDLLLERHRNGVVNFLYRMVQNHATAEELAQEVFIRVYRSRETYEPTAKFTTWLYRIATHLALNWLRDNKRRRQTLSIDEVATDKNFDEAPVRQLADATPSIEESMVREAKFAEIRQAISRLPEKQRAAVLMHKFQEMDYSQIAKSLACSESAVKSILFRAYETLRSRLRHMAQ